MGLKLQASEADAINALRGDPTAQAKAIEITPKNKPNKSPGKLTRDLPQVNITWVAIIIGLIILLKWNPQQTASNQLLESVPDMGHKTVISGKIETKQINQSGGIKLIINNQYHNQQYRVIVSPDITSQVDLKPGALIKITADPIGDDTYTVSDIHNIQELTQVVNFESIENVHIINHIAMFQSG